MKIVPPPHEEPCDDGTPEPDESRVDEMRALEEELLERLRAGSDHEAASMLLSLLYEDLRRIAHAKLRNEPFQSTLRTTDLVDRTYERLLGGDRTQCRDRVHFLARAACAMRSIVSDHYRRRTSGKALPMELRVPLDGIVEAFEARAGDFGALDEALRRLREREQRAAQVVELRFFLDCSVAECAEILACSPRTVEREWEFARGFLAAELRA